MVLHYDSGVKEWSMRLSVLASSPQVWKCTRQDAMFQHGSSVWCNTSPRRQQRGRRCCFLGLGSMLASFEIGVGQGSKGLLIGKGCLGDV